MLIVNNDKIQTFSLDTRNTILLRIAARLGTLDKYLYNIPEKLQGKITIKDLLSEIKQTDDIEKFISEKKEIIVKNSLDIINDIFIPWMNYNDTVKELLQDTSMLSLLLEPQLQKYNINLEYVISLLPNFEISLQKFKNASKQNDILLSKFDNINTEELAKFTKFNPSKISLTYNIELSDISLSELFNSIILNVNTPFAYYDSYYKILNNFSPSDDWGYIEDKKSITLKVSQKQKEVESFEDYTDVKIYLKEDKFYTDFSLILGKQEYIDEKVFVERITHIFNIPVKLGQRTEIQVKGIFYFPKKRFNSYIFSDLVCLDDTFNSMISINEKTKVSKKKKEAGTSWIYLHFKHFITDEIWCGIIEKPGDRKDQETKTLDENIFPHGEPYIRIVISKAKNENLIREFQIMFSKILYFYDLEKDNIISAYKKFISNFGDIQPYKLSQYKKSELPEDIFIENYSRKCPNIPSILNDKSEIVKLLKTSPEKILEFPKEKPNNYYVCNKSDVYSFPGVQKNQLLNKDVYPYIPCCYKKDQTNTDNYNEYYKNIFKQREKKQQELIITNKILDNNEFGILSKELEIFFNLIDNDTSYKYIRIGVGRNTSSFITAVLLGLYEKNISVDGERLDVLSLNETERYEKVNKLRKKLSQKDICVLGKQNMYNIDIDNISKNLRDLTIYLNPRQYVQLLEEYLDCNIFIFNEQQMVLPYFSEGYYRRDKNTETIFIYEHMGSESDNASYPQCELIVRWYTGKNQTDYFFRKGEKVVQNIEKVFFLLNESFCLCKPIINTVFNIQEYIPLENISQFVDTYGKTRQIDIKFRQDIFSLLLEPIPPLPCRIKEDQNIYKTTIKKALEFFQNLNIKPISQDLGVKNGTCKVISFLGNVEIAVFIQEVQDKILENIKVNSTGIHVENNNSTLERFNKNKKIARYISEYVFWTFSRYLNNLKNKTITDKTLADFAKKSFTIKSDYNYMINSKLFKENNILENSKIVVSSEEMIKRLMYLLKLTTVQNLKKIEKYHEKNSITDFYIDITDFDYYPNQIILKGEGSVSKWNFENNFKPSLFSHVNVETTKPYFIKNTLFGDTVYLAQNSNSLKDAINICLFWDKKGYNPIDEIEKKGITDYEFIFYNYKSSTDIVKYLVKGTVKPERPIIIAGLKNEGITIFVSLLTLN